MTFRRTTLITIGCVAALAGLGLSRKISLNFQDWWLIFLPLLALLKPKNKTSLVLAILLGLGLGLWRGNLYMQKLADLKSYAGKTVTLNATATTDAIYSANYQMEFNASNASLAGNNHPLAGSFKISGFGTNMVYRGDRLRVTGKLYPTRGANQARISYAQVGVTGQDTSIINRLTRKFSAGMQSALPEPQASFALGLLIGQRSTLPQEIVAALTLVGLVHIVAVSGYNVTILARAAARLRLGSKYQQLMLSIVLIIGFVLVTGFSASIVRAAIVSILTLWAWFYGRKIRPVLLLSFTAALTGLVSPFYVWSDLGWYLSFLAFFGIILVAPVITNKLFRRSPKLVGMVVIETLCAEIMTLPLIMVTFSQASIVALVANLLVVPLVPLAMLLSAIAATAGALFPAAAGWLAWPAKELLTYMLDIAHLLAHLPFAAKQVGLTWASMAFVYFILGLMALAINHSLTRRKQTI